MIRPPGHDYSWTDELKHIQECSLKKQWRPTNSTSSACPKAWPLPSDNMPCCDKGIASIEYTYENQSSTSSICETQEQQLRMQGASLLRGKQLFLIGDSVSHHWLNAMLLDAQYNSKEQLLFHNNTSIWKKYWNGWNHSLTYFEYDERGFCAFPFEGFNMSSLWPSAPSIVSARYPGYLCPPIYKKALYQKCCPGGNPLSYTGAISAKLNETKPFSFCFQLQCCLERTAHDNCKLQCP